MSGFNLSAWALERPSLIRFFMIALAAAGIWSYFSLGKAEDPDFTMKIMIVRTLWPGATAIEVEQQVTDRIEKKLQETPYFDNLRSFSRAGESVVYVFLKDHTPPKEVPGTWYQVRKKVSDIRGALPEGVVGPFFNDEFGDTFGIVYAFTSDGFSHAELRRMVDDVRQELLSIADMGKIELIGVQPEKIFIEVSHHKLATLGIDPNIIIQTLQRQNATSPSGIAETRSDRIYMRVSGDFDSAEAVRAIGIQANGRIVRLGDVATVTRGYVDPPALSMRYKGEDAIGLAISMAKGGDNIVLGDRVDAAMRRIEANLPVGVDVHKVHDQPKVVVRSFNEFMTTLFEAVAIVLAVSFLSLGWRTGLVVALSIPLVIATTFLLMKVFGIDFQRISLGALVIALGLLVDDAIIAVEMMLVKMEQGWDRFRAASFAYTSTAFPMLTGTLITAAGFVPVGFAKSAAGEYTFSIFAVLTISLLVSWVVAVVFTPYIGAAILPDPRPRIGTAQGHDHDAVYQGRFYRIFRGLVDWCVEHRWIVIAATLAAFVFSAWAFKFVQQQFFPSSNRPELIVDLRLPEGSSIHATATEAKRLEAVIAGDPDIRHFVTYIGGGTPRFYLPLDVQQPQVGLAQIVIQTLDDDARERVRGKIQNALDEGFEMVRGRVNRLENGPPVGFPVQFRVLGENPIEVRRIAGDVMRVMRENPWTSGVHLDWNELSKVVDLDIDQDKARVVGLSTQDLSLIMNSIMSGVTVTQYRERNDLIDVVFRAVPEERLSLEGLRDINIPHASGRPMPVSQLATIKYGFEEGVIWRRDRLPTITVRADVDGDIQAPVVSMQIEKALDAFRKDLPAGYRIEMGGAIEESAKGQGSIIAVVPAMILIMLTLLMVQLQNMQRMVLTFLTAPLGIIGVTWALLASNRPFGFVAMLGTIALGGMIIRNSVILVDQIEQDIKAGQPAWTAIVESAVRRFRPIMLTALAAVLGMIPLARSNFWGPMATAIMGGLLVATVLTLLSFPAMYAAWFRVKRPA